MIAPAGPITVPTPGTPVWAASLWPNAADRPQVCHGLMFQALPGNTGLVYVGVQGMDKSTYVGVLAFVAIPTVNHIPAFSTAITLAPNALALNSFWIDADVADDGVIISLIVL